jgi:hypothetical protein
MFLERLGRPSGPQRLAQDPPVLLLGRVAVTGGANLQLAHDIALYVTDQKLRHGDSNAST